MTTSTYSDKSINMYEIIKKCIILLTATTKLFSVVQIQDMKGRYSVFTVTMLKYSHKIFIVNFEKYIQS